MRFQRRSKSRLYGAPRMLKSIVNVSSSLHTYSVQSLYLSSTYRELKDELKAKDDLITEMKKN